MRPDLLEKFHRVEQTKSARRHFRIFQIMKDFPEQIIYVSDKNLLLEACWRKIQFKRKNMKKTDLLGPFNSFVIKCIRRRVRIYLLTDFLHDHVHNFHHRSNFTFHQTNPFICAWKTRINKMWLNSHTGMSRKQSKLKKNNETYRDKLLDSCSSEDGIQTHSSNSASSHHLSRLSLQPPLMESTFWLAQNLKCTKKTTKTLQLKKSYQVFESAAQKNKTQNSDPPSPSPSSKCSSQNKVVRKNAESRTKKHRHCQKSSSQQAIFKRIMLHHPVFKKYTTIHWYLRH